MSEEGESSDYSVQILAPMCKKLPGRPKSKRIPSRGEKVRKNKVWKVWKEGKSQQEDMLGGYR